MKKVLLLWITAGLLLSSFGIDTTENYTALTEESTITWAASRPGKTHDGTLAISSGSACTSASLEPSYVLRALGLSDELAHSSLRFSFGRFTTEEEVDYAVDQIHQAVNKLRELSPLWDMFKDGVDLNSIEWAAH